MTTEGSLEIRTMLERFGLILVRISGPSMTPSLREGEVVEVHRAKVPQVVDVVLFEVSGSLEIHRLVDRIDAGMETWYVHEGDTASACGLASRKDVLGVAKVERRQTNSAPRGHLWGLLLRLGVLLRRLGLASPAGYARWGSRVVKRSVLGFLA